MSSRCVAVFGGSFNPPHVGHVLAASYVLSVFPVDGLLAVPVFQHPFDKALASYEDRLQMARLALEWLPGVQVSDIERELGGESRTLYTIEALLRERPERALRLVIGADVLHDLHAWHRFDRIAELAPPIILGRAGVEHPDAPRAHLPEVSSSQIRAAVEQGRVAEVTTLLPRKVLDFVQQQGLYQQVKGQSS